MLWGCFSAASPGRPIKAEKDMNADKYAPKQRNDPQTTR